MKCAVITPIGPGHEDIFETGCRASVAQARAFDQGPFTEILHYAMDDTAGRHGRSDRRNAALARAAEEGVDWVFFLDADDVMTPNAFEAFGRLLAAEPDLDAVWGLICEFDAEGEPQLRPGQPERLDSRVELLAVPPFLSLQIGAFIRAPLAARIGFDTAMDAGEDFKFYYRLWAEARCAKRPEIFFVNRRGQHSHGPRAATGADWSAAVTDLWRAELAALPVHVPIRDGGIEARMRLTNPADLIQATHLRGEFFESASLAKLRGLVRAETPAILEVGANIGNHVVWYAQHLGAARIYPVEPNPAALDLLDQNIAVNGLSDRIDRRGFGKGAGAARARFDAVTDQADNLGATRLVASDSGAIEVLPLDELMGPDRVDVIKIDAEGMEIDVLAGARQLIARDRPVIWVEVLRENILPFARTWCREAGYRIVASTPYVHTMDYFAVPAD